MCIHASAHKIKISRATNFVAMLPAVDVWHTFVYTCMHPFRQSHINQSTHAPTHQLMLCQNTYAPRRPCNARLQQYPVVLTLLTHIAIYIYIHTLSDAPIHIHTHLTSVHDTLPYGDSRELKTHSVHRCTFPRYKTLKTHRQGPAHSTASTALALAPMKKHRRNRERSSLSSEYDT